MEEKSEQQILGEALSMPEMSQSAIRLKCVEIAQAYSPDSVSDLLVSATEIYLFLKGEILVQRGIETGFPKP